MFFLKQQEHPDPKILGRPEDYPVPPDSENLLFYIQRNQNKDTIVYELNRNANNEMNQSCPMHPYWIKYNSGGEVSELNYVQNKLAYGYEHDVLGNDSVSFNFVSYKTLKFYIDKAKNGRYHAICKIANEMSIIDNVYVYAEELGVFPIVKYIELYGRNLLSDFPVYEKIVLENQ